MGEIYTTSTWVFFLFYSFTTFVSTGRQIAVGLIQNTCSHARKCLLEILLMLDHLSSFLAAQTLNFGVPRQEIGTVLSEAGVILVTMTTGMG